jgi:hypothetical protein
MRRLVELAVVGKMELVEWVLNVHRTAKEPCRGTGTKVSVLSHIYFV